MKIRASVRKICEKCRLIRTDRHESPTTLHCQNPCCIFERG